MLNSHQTDKERWLRMRLKISVGILLTALLCVTVFTAAALRLRNNETATSSKGAGEIQIEVVQLPAVNDVVPVEIRGETIINNAPYDELKFVVKNNTNSAIDAITVAVTSRAETRGREFSSTAYMSVDRLIHPDIREIHHQKTIGPGGESSFGPEPLELVNGTTLKGITLKIDYVDFEDKTSLGPNVQGSVLINKMREGAAKYKGWLVQVYFKSGRSLNAVIPLLKERTLPKELNLAGGERPGAQLYRKHFLMAYERHGSEEIEKYLNR
jgi:hypothetical protein